MVFAYQLHMASLLMSPTVFITFRKLYCLFHLHEFFNDLNLLLKWFISNWTLANIIHGVINVFVISHQPHALCLFDFEITCLIIPRIIIHLSSPKLLHLQIVITAKIPPRFNVAQRWPIWFWFWWMWWGISVLWKSITGTSKVTLL